MIHFITGSYLKGIPETETTVLLISHHCISLPQLEQNLLSTMHMRLHDVAVNERTKFECLEATNLSHTISVRDICLGRIRCDTPIVGVRTSNL
jgi:hypothetical protein